MKTHWITAVLLSAGLVTACNTQSGQEFDEQTTTPAEESAAADATGPASSPADTPARSDTAGSNASARPTAPTTRPGSGSAERPQTPAPAQPQTRELEVATGTGLPLTLDTALSSKTATVEMPVQATLKQGISVEGVTVLPAGTRLNGTVTEVQQSGRVKGRARVTFVLTEAVINGARHEITTDPITFEAQGTQGEDATKIGVGAAVGAAVGGILGGGSGAAKGAAIGGAAGTGAVLATRGEHVDVAEGTDIAATLARPFTMRVRVQ